MATLPCFLNNSIYGKLIDFYYDYNIFAGPSLHTSFSKHLTEFSNILPTETLMNHLGIYNRIFHLFYLIFHNFFSQFSQ